MTSLLKNKTVSTYRGKFFFALIISTFIYSIFNGSLASAYTTDTNIYTPPQYTTFQPPAVGGSYSDPVFQTAVKRLSDSMHTTDAAWGTGVAKAISPEYATMSPFNKDNTRLLLQTISYFRLHDGAGNYLKDLPFEINTSAEPRWSRTDPNVLYYVNGNSLKSYNVGTGAMTAVHTFSEYSAISGKGESDIGFNGNRLVFAGDSRYVFTYDVDSGTKSNVYDAGASGLFDQLYLTPDDNVLVGYYANGSSRKNGVELFDKNMNFVRQIVPAIGHMDVTRDTTGEEVLVWVNAAADGQLQVPCSAGVTKVRLSDAKQTCLWTGDWTMAEHVTAPDNSGWAFIETYVPSDIIPPNGWSKYANELLQVKLDGSEVRRLVHHRSRPFDSYSYQPKATVSRDGTKLVYGSNFGLQAQLGNPKEYTDAYMIDLTAASPGTGGSATGGTATSGTTTTTTSSTPTSTTTTTSTPTSTTTTSTPTTTTTRLEQNDASVTYTGNWMSNSSGNHSGSSAAMAVDAGSRATFTFNGTGANWIAYTDEWSGFAKVYVDGNLKGEMDTYASPFKAQVKEYSVGGLTSGNHTLAVEVSGKRNTSSGGSWVWVDAFEVIKDASTTSSTTTTTTSTPTTTTTAPTSTTTTTAPTSTTTTTAPTSTTTTTAPTSTTTITAPTATTTTTAPTATTTTTAPTSTTTTTAPTATTTTTAPTATTTTTTTSTVKYRIEPNSSAIQYGGAWSAISNAAFTGGSAVQSAVTGARATLTFTGNYIRWIQYRDVDGGKARIYLDGVLMSTADTYSATPMRATKTFSNLAYGQHTIVIEVAGRKNAYSTGYNIIIDAFEYYGAALTAALQTDTSPGKALVAGTSSTSSGGQPLQVGYAEVTSSAGVSPAGLAIFGYRQNGILVSEAGVPASFAVLRGRISAESSGPARTGFAIANPNDTPATVSFFFADENGNSFGQSSLTLPPHGQLARFLNEAPFNSPQLTNASFSFSSNIPVSAIALRGFINERSEFLVTTLPIADLDEPSSNPVFFPHIADGGGWRTQFVLVNPSDQTISGTLRLNSASIVADGQSNGSIAYTIAPRASRRFATLSIGSNITVGAATVTPSPSNIAPVGVAIFSFKNAGVTVSEAGVPALEGGNAFRLYAEMANGGALRTGVAILNTSSTDRQVNFELTSLDGQSTGLTGSMTLPAQAQRAMFLNEIPGFQSLPMPFKGILRISAGTSPDIAVMGLRGRVNERGDFLITTTNPTNENESAADRLIFPHIVDGGGYTTQFVLYSGTPDEPATGNLNVFSQSGGSLNLNLR